jgi:hypothetical protein
VERLPVRCAALACVIAGGLLISGPGLLASADPGSGGTGSTGSGGDPQSTDNGATSKGLLSALSTLPGLGFLSQLPGGTGPTIGPVRPPLMNLSSSMAPGTAPNGPKPVRAFMLPNPDNQQWVGVTTPGRQQPPAVVDLQPAVGGIAPPSQGQQQGAQVVPLTTSGVPVGPIVTFKNPAPGAILPQVLPPPLVLLLTVIANDVPLAGLVITPLLNATLPPLLANLLTNTVPTLSPGTVTPSVPSQAGPALLSVSGPPPADLSPMGMDLPKSPGPTPPVSELPPLLTSPDNGVSALNEPVAFRAGYSDYLRNAGMAQITAIAVPGAVAILLFSLGGGFIGYRQARAGHIIRAEGITRFLH